LTKPLRLAALLAGPAALLLSSILLDGWAGRLPQTETLRWSSTAFSLLGNGGVLISISALLYIAGRALGDDGLRGAGRDAFSSVLVGSVMVHLLKAAFERPRISHAAGYVIAGLDAPRLFDTTGRFISFPSGHTTVSFALAWAISRRYPRLSVPLYAVAALIGASRVYLGSHYPSDIAGGVLTGLAAGWLVTTGFSTAEARGRWMLAGLVLLTLCLSFFKSGGYLLFDVDEAVFSEASREMLETGDFITPTHNYEPRYDKPILFYWFMALAFRLFGVSEFAARFTSGAFSTLLVLMTFLFVRRVNGERAAYLSSLALLLNLEAFVYSHSAVTDMTLTFFIAAALYSFYLAVHEERPGWMAVFWASSALAVLTKGAIGVLFPAATAFLYLLGSRGLSRVKTLFRPAHVVLFLAIAAPWFVLELRANGWEFFNAFVIKHHLRRYSGVISGHSGAPYYYLAVLLIGFFPWVAFLPIALYRGFKERLAPGSGLTLLCSVWFVFVLVFFSISRTKLPNYIMPLFPGAAIIAGLAASELIGRTRGRVPGERAGLYILAALSGAAGAVVIVFPSASAGMHTAFPPRFFHALGAIFVLTAVLSLAALKRPRTSLAGIAALAGVMLVFMRLVALPVVNNRLQRALYRYAVYARDAGPGTVLATYGINRPSISFYSRGRILQADGGGLGLIAENSGRSRLVVITDAARVKELETVNGLKVIDSDGSFALLDNSAEPTVLR
jgi:4-amino-4-deoxy-L-arabinose transferase-like glycosyltransferase/membrane-associated phospholipid phosphatase